MCMIKNRLISSSLSAFQKYLILEVDVWMNTYILYFEHSKKGRLLTFFSPQDPESLMSLSCKQVFFCQLPLSHIWGSADYLQL